MRCDCYLGRGAAQAVVVGEKPLWLVSERCLQALVDLTLRLKKCADVAFERVSVQIHRRCGQAAALGRRSGTSGIRRFHLDAARARNSAAIFVLKIKLDDLADANVKAAQLLQIPGDIFHLNARNGSGAMSSERATPSVRRKMRTVAEQIACGINCLRGGECGGCLFDTLVKSGQRSPEKSHRQFELPTNFRFADLVDQPAP